MAEIAVLMGFDSVARFLPNFNAESICILWMGIILAVLC